jgi:hypothetical protein
MSPYTVQLSALGGAVRFATDSFSCQYEEILKKFPQIVHVVSDFARFLHFSRRTTLNLTLKFKEFRGHFFRRGIPVVGEQTTKMASKSEFPASSYSHSSLHDRQTVRSRIHSTRWPVGGGLPGSQYTLAGGGRPPWIRRWLRMYIRCLDDAK